MWEGSPLHVVSCDGALEDGDDRRGLVWSRHCETRACKISLGLEYGAAARALGCLMHGISIAAPQVGPGANEEKADDDEAVRVLPSMSPAPARDRANASRPRAEPWATDDTIHPEKQWWWWWWWWW